MLDPPDGFSATPQIRMPEIITSQQQQQQQDTETNENKQDLLDQYLNSYTPNHKKGNKNGKHY